MKVTKEKLITITREYRIPRIAAQKLGITILLYHRLLLYYKIDINKINKLKNIKNTKPNTQQVVSVKLIDAPTVKELSIPHHNNPNFEDDLKYAIYDFCTTQRLNTAQINTVNDILERGSAYENYYIYNAINGY